MATTVMAGPLFELVPETRAGSVPEFGLMISEEVANGRTKGMR